MRSFIRHPSDFPVELSLAEQDEGDYAQRTKNLSGGGLCCDSRDRLPVGASVHVRIPVGEKPFESEGTIAWCMPSDRGYEVGIRFTQQEASHSLRMVEDVCRIRRYRQDIWELEGRELTEEQAAREWLIHYHGADLMD